MTILQVSDYFLHISVLISLFLERPELLDCPSFPSLSTQRSYGSVSDTSRKSINMRTGIITGLVLGYKQLKYDAHLIMPNTATPKPCMVLT